ncbi:MAG: PQQ-dependent sugar dehydrogenase [Verrucomicrobiales bacterium]|nr:PQQ-dependent sugar dehydrogenase [Verrucomicrobiales bacterium]
MNRAFVLLMLTAALSATGAEPFDEGRLEREVLAADLNDGIQLQVAPNGDVYFIERGGALRCWSPVDKAARTVGSVPVKVGGEYGLIGLALDGGFARNGWIYLLYAPVAEDGKLMRLSRFTIADEKLDPASEKVLLSYPIRNGHQGGGMQFDGQGNLWIGVGDAAIANLTPETDERPGKEAGNALATAANTQDLRGKILRIHPRPDGGYSIPAGNLFADAKQGRPEIFIMGCRNPYRLHFDDATGRLFWAEVGSNTEERFGTGGFDEINVSTRPANSGWPLFIGPNTPYRRYDHAADKLGDFYDPAHPVNDSRLNTGLRELPKPLPALLWYGSEDSKEFPELGNGGRSAMAGPVYHFDAKLVSDLKLPEVFDGRLFIYDWCRCWLKSVALTADGRVGKIEPFMGGTQFRRPLDLKPGPDGTLYLLEFGEQWSGNKDGRLSRLVYRRGNRVPKAVITADVPARRRVARRVPRLPGHCAAAARISRGADARAFALERGGARTHRRLRFRPQRLRLLHRRAYGHGGCVWRGTGAAGRVVPRCGRQSGRAPAQAAAALRRQAHTHARASDGGGCRSGVRRRLGRPRAARRRVRLRAVQPDEPAGRGPGHRGQAGVFPDCRRTSPPRGLRRAGKRSPRAQRRERRPPPANHRLTAHPPCSPAPSKSRFWLAPC